MPPEAENQNTDAKNEKAESESTTDDAGRAVEQDPEDVSGLKSAIAKERDARKAAAAEAAKAKEERDALLAEKREREAAEVKRKEAEAKEAGKFQELAEAREKERDDAKTEAAALKAENDQYKAAVEKVLTDEWKALPAEAIEAYEAAGGKDDDPLGKLGFLPAGKKIAAKLAAADPKRGNEGGPKSTGNGKVDDTAARSANATRYT